MDTEDIYVGSKSGSGSDSTIGGGSRVEGLGD